MDALELTRDERQQIGEIREQGFTLNFLYGETFAASNSFFQSQASAAPFVLPFPCLIQTAFVSGMITGGTVSRVVDPASIRLQITQETSLDIGSVGFDKPSLFGTLAASWSDSGRLVLNGIDSGKDLSVMGLVTSRFYITLTVEQNVSAGETGIMSIMLRIKRA